MKVASYQWSVISVAVYIMLFTRCIAVEAQQTKRIYRIGYITNRTEIGPNEEALRRGLRELGYAEGDNLVIEWRFIERGWSGTEKLRLSWCVSRLIVLLLQG